MEQNRKIDVRKRGNALGVWFFKASLAMFGLKAAHGLLYLVCIHYLIFDREAVNGAMAYIKRRFPEKGTIAWCLDVYKLFVSQGKQLIDRYAALSGHVNFDFDLLGMEQIKDAVKESDKGLVLLTSHVGNWQIAMTTLENLGKDVYLVMRPEDNEAMKKTLKISNAGEYIKIISPEDYLGGVVEIMNALKAGNIVSIMGDRAYGFELLEVDFLGDKAWFPYGAFKIAAAAECPILFLLSTRESGKRYKVDLSHSMRPAYKGRKDRRGQLAGWVRQYADILSEYIRKYPYQCFLFHDVWKKEEPTKTGVRSSQ